MLGYENKSWYPYIYQESNTGSESILPLFVELWFVILLLLNNFIPISLYVTLELVNLGQSYFMGNDLNMYSEEIDSPCIVRTSSLLQELGLVSNIFSDKTGTLTKNEMKLIKFVINNQIYDVYENSESTPNSNISEIVMNNNKNNNDNSSKNLNSSLMYDFFKCLILCHTVVKDSNNKYRAESPDELALVYGAEQFSFNLIERGSSTIKVNLAGKVCEYDILFINQFNADRKRMSILLKELSTKKYYLLCKGADTTMVIDIH